MDEELIFLQKENIHSAKEALQFLSKQLLEKGIVNKDFEKAILDREQVFPTGLQFDGYGVAIPHTDAEFVNNTKIAIMTLKDPVEFTQMATNDQLVPVKLIMMLAIPNAHSQVELLQKVVTVLQDKDIIMKLLDYSDNQKADFLNLLSTYHII